MGIPAFYRWLVSRYPKAAVDVVEEKSTFVNGVRVPIDTTQPNPNGYEIDNLYLDMNGIAHPCFHPEDLTAPKTYDEVFKAVFKYVDRIFSIVRPRKFLYLAIDGVAPRAKMNQQRARRFRAAKDAADEASGAETPRGIHEPEVGNVATAKLDSNVITPGTEFMGMLSSALRYYIHLKMNEDPGWQGIKVILSDATVPGEGEHKIMSYIRLQRNLPGFNANTHHCLYGLDADLIMLALATHEIHFSILREDIRKIQMNSKRVKKREDPLPFSENVDNVISRQKFQFLNIWVLRDYLAHDLRIPDPTVKSDLERLIDDFVFMCLFVGNDFLPHVPSLEISEGAIDLLMFVYKKEFVQMGGYLTNSFEVNLDRVEHFVQAVGLHENAIFRKRSEVNKQMEIRFRRSLTNPQKDRATSFQGSVTNHSNKKEIWKSPSNMFDNGISAIDKIKLGEEGCKERYYTEKFEVKTDADIEAIQRHAVLKYVEGICWVMHYYYQGVCSWQWFYPYHYAPFASDFYSLNHLEIHFTLGKPFKPFDQLMGVLPAASAQALPLSYRKLMTDPSSAILDFYPSDFELDMNGKRLAWQAICKLPFIDESRLLSEITRVESTLTDEEKQRNSLGLDMLFVHVTHPLAVKIFSFFERNKDNPKLFKAKVKKKINPKFSDGMNGFIYVTDKPVSPMEIFSPVDDMVIITNNKVISVMYQYPSFHSHIPKPPEGVVMPEKVVSEQDLLPQPILWHEKSAIFGRKFSERLNPKSIWGPSLAKLAHRLVSEYYFAKQQQTMGGVDANCINGEARKWKRSKICDEPMDNKIKKKKRKPRKSTKPRVIEDVCTEGYIDWKERMLQEINCCDGSMDTKDDDQAENMSKDDDQTEYKIQKEREKRHKSNFEQQATTDGTGNYTNGEDRMKQQSNDCDGPMDTKGNDQTENKIQKKRRKRRKSNFAEQQATTNGIGNHINGEDRMKQQSNDCDDPRFTEKQKTTDEVGEKSEVDEDRMKPQRKDCDHPEFAGQQITTDGVGEKSINDEDRMKPQRNDCDEPKFTEQQNITDGVGEKFINDDDRTKLQSNNCNNPTDNKIGNSKRKKRRASKFAEQEATTFVVSETHINGENIMKPQGYNCGSSVDNKTEKKRRKKCRSKFEEKQATMDVVGENCINGEEKMKQLSNDCDNPTDNKIEKKRKKRRSKKRKIEANVERGNEAEVVESLLTDSATLVLSADSSIRKLCLQDTMEGGTIN